MSREFRLFARLFQSLDQEEDFGGHCVAQIGSVSEGEVAAAVDDGLESVDEEEEPRGVGVSG